jgi:secondary thiamine-phosphate synthase enzyme
MVFTSDFDVSTHGRGHYDISREIAQAVRQSGITTGLCNIFVHHTSASLILCENADPAVRDDLSAWFDRLVKEGDALYTHTSEGLDDMPAHIRATLTPVTLAIPVRKGELAVGTWQGIYLWEHRRRAHERHVSVTVLGD